MTDQMTLDLRTDAEIAAEKDRREYVRSPAYAYDWLMDVHGCTEAVISVCERLYATFAPLEAFERCKCLVSLDGKRRKDGWTLDDCDVLGLFDDTIDYGDCWERHEAAKHGVAKEDIPRMLAWDYAKKQAVFA